MPKPKKCARNSTRASKRKTARPSKKQTSFWNAPFECGLCVDTLQDLQRQKESADFKQKLEQTRENVRKRLGMVSKDTRMAEKIEAEYLPPRELVVGDSVELADLGKVGEIASIDGENATVAIGSAKIKTKLSKLRLVEQKKPAKIDRHPYAAQGGKRYHGNRCARRYLR